MFRLMLILHVIHVFLSIKTCSFSKRIFRNSPSQQIIKSQNVDEISGDWKNIRLNFMKKYWNKRPLLVRGAFPRLAAGYHVLSKEDLMHVSHCDELSSRLIRNAYHVQGGPFTEVDFSEVLDEDASWSLLVNDMERVVPEIHALVEMFDCVPSWQHDDVMVSCGSVGSTIGAHVDSYDVFLVDLSGKRTWEIDNTPMSCEDEYKRLFQDGRSLRVLKENDFKVSHSWRMGPGDMLYLPPRIPHRSMYVLFYFIFCI